MQHWVTLPHHLDSGQRGPMLNHSCLKEVAGQGDLTRCSPGLYTAALSVTWRYRNKIQTSPVQPSPFPSLLLSSSITSLQQCKSPHTPSPPQARPRSGYWSLIRWMQCRLITNRFITQHYNAGQDEHHCFELQTEPQMLWGSVQCECFTYIVTRNFSACSEGDLCMLTHQPTCWKCWA